MAKYKVKAGKEGYINDRMEKDGAVFEAKEGLTGSWFDPLPDVAPEAAANEPDGAVDPENPPEGGPAVVDQAAVEEQAAAEESAVAESGDGMHTAETAAAELDDDVETL